MLKPRLGAPEMECLLQLWRTVRRSSDRRGEAFSLGSRGVWVEFRLGVITCLSLNYISYFYIFERGCAILLESSVNLAMNQCTK